MPITMTAGKEKWKSIKRRRGMTAIPQEKCVGIACWNMARRCSTSISLDAIELHSLAGGVQGVAFVLPHAADNDLSPRPPGSI